MHWFTQLASFLLSCAFALALFWVGSQNAYQNVHPTPPEQLDTSSNKAGQQANSSRVELSQARRQHGYMRSTRDSEVFHSKDLPAAVKLIPGTTSTRSFLWQDRGGTPFAYAASGIDKHHYFANSYLVGFVPYQTKDLWKPLATLALRKVYQFDHQKLGPSWRDVWQNSEQAYRMSHGDCEDHALILTDWLIGLGYDARVVIGTVPSGGHAWVVLFMNGKEYLIESTSKRLPSSQGDFKLAKYSTEYHPIYQFNRTEFWANTGTKFTTSYNDEKWRKTANFQASYDRPEH